MLINRKKLIITLFAAGALSLGAQAQYAQNVLGISDSSTVSRLILPESFEADTKAMLENWYLKTYAVLDYKADSRPDADVSDELLIERLGKLPVEMEMPLNTPVKNSILFYANRRKQLVENMLGLSLYYMPIFEQALDKYQMPRELRYLPIIESALDPSAVSRAGAVGLWQIMAPTAGGLGLEMNSLVDERRDPYASTDAAVRYLKQLYETYGDWSLAIAAYNCGPGNVNKALRRVGGGKHDFWDIYPFLPSETRGYVPAFIAANYIMNYHKDHNISPALARRPIITDTVNVTRRVHFEQISDVLDIPMNEIRALNPQYRKDIIPGDIKPYPLVLPSLQTLAYVANEDSIVNHNAQKYARRSVVEPAVAGAVSGTDSRGEYVDELVTQYHTVKRGETLSSIARKYGVTVSSIRKANKIGKTVRRGQRLKIQTYRRRYIETPVAQPADTTATPATTQAQATEAAAPSDSIPEQSVVEPTDSVSTGQQVSEAFRQVEEPSPAAQAKPKKTTAPAAPKSVRHKVRRGDNLFKIAKHYGVTVDQIKNANGLTSDNISVGQRLTIPQK